MARSKDTPRKELVQALQLLMRELDSYPSLLEQFEALCREKAVWERQSNHLTAQLSHLQGIADQFQEALSKLLKLPEVVTYVPNYEALGMAREALESFEIYTREYGRLS